MKDKMQHAAAGHVQALRGRGGSLSPFRQSVTVTLSQVQHFLYIRPFVAPTVTKGIFPFCCSNCDNMLNLPFVPLVT